MVYQEATGSILVRAEAVCERERGVRKARVSCKVMLDVAEENTKLYGYSCGGCNAKQDPHYKVSL